LIYNRAMSGWRQLEMMLASSKVNYYFCASFLIVVVAVLIKLPSLVTSAEFYAETMTIFFSVARNATFTEILTFVEADYLVTFQLLVSYVLIRIFGIIDHFPGAVNFVFLLFIAFCVSLINLRAFRILIESDFVRFMLGVSIGLTPYIEVYQLLHANLFGIMIYFLFIFVDKEQFNRWLFYTLIFLLFMTGIARPNLIVFLPVYIILMGLAIHKGRVRDIIFYGTGAVSLGIQAFVMIMAQLYWSMYKDTGIYNDISGIESIFSAAFVASVYYLRTVLAVIFQDISGRYILTGLLFVTGVLILSACYYLYRRKKYFILYFFSLSQILAFGLIYFIAFSSPASVGLDWSIIRYDPMRWWAYSNFVIYISLMVLLYHTLREVLSGMPVKTLQHVSPAIAVIVLSLLAVLFHIRPFYLYVDPYAGSESLSNWGRYRHLMTYDDYYIPINPVHDFQWGLSKDNDLLHIDIKSADWVKAISFPEVQESLQLRGILLVNQDYYDSMEDLIIKVYDMNGTEIATPQRLDDFRDKYLYYKFSERVSPARMTFYNEKHERVSIKPELMLIGKLDSDQKVIVANRLD